jgi:class 3 adenylate cyclase
MDIHRLPEGVTADMVRDAHNADMQLQAKYGVNYRGYWFDSVRGTVACLAEGPSSEACVAVHKHAHGLVADTIIEVTSDNVTAFLGGGDIAPTGEAVHGDGTLDAGLRVVVVTELHNLAGVGSRLGDAAALKILQRHDHIVRKAAATHYGREVRHLGDGMMLSFAAASFAVQCALAIQSACAADKTVEDEGLSVRIGMAAGEPVAQHTGLFGVPVDHARVLARAARPGEILVSVSVQALCAGKGLAFDPAPPVALPGSDDRLLVVTARDPSAPAPVSPQGGSEDQPRQLRAALAGRYDLEHELGHGGMATVHLARDVRHDRRVAIKVLRPELAAVLGVDRFLQEIRVAAQLTHPHIVALYDSGEAGGVLYYVMPNLEGESLRAHIERDGPMAVDRVVEIARSVGGALDYAHRKGVVHRDIKPENILMHEGQPMVLDFGIALAVTHARGSRMTEPGIALGTPAYMSPEQALGDPDVDGRADVYALGCVVYEMLAGEPPFTASNVQALVAKIVADRPTPLARHRPDLPSPIEQAVHRALEKTPADRFDSAGAFAAALQPARGWGQPSASQGSNTQTPA